MASKEPKVTAADTVALSIGDIIQRLRDGLTAISEAWPIIRPRLRGKTPPGDLRNLASIAEELAQDERDHIAEFGLRIMDWLDAGAPPYLDSYLGLRQRGGLSPGHELALAERNRALRRLHGEQWPESPAGEAAKLMIQSFKRYRGGQWSRDHDAEHAPMEQPELMWWQLLRTKQRMLGEKRLKAILEDRD